MQITILFFKQTLYILLQISVLKQHADDCILEWCYYVMPLL